MTLPEIRRGFPTYRSASGEEPERVAARKVDSRGLGISYDDVGEGPTIVLISGFSQSGGDWWELGYVDRLVALGRRVLVVDPLGHGSSDRPHDPGAYRWPDVALDIVATMDAAGVTQAILWGFSRGAALAACIATERPDRAVGVILGAGGDLGDTPPIGLSPPIEALLVGLYNVGTVARTQDGVRFVVDDGALGRWGFAYSPNGEPVFIDDEEEEAGLWTGAWFESVGGGWWKWTQGWD